MFIYAQCSRKSRNQYAVKSTHESFRHDCLTDFIIVRSENLPSIHRICKQIFKWICKPICKCSTNIFLLKISIRPHIFHVILQIFLPINRDAKANTLVKFIASNLMNNINIQHWFECQQWINKCLYCILPQSHDEKKEQWERIRSYGIVSNVWL